MFSRKEKIIRPLFFVFQGVTEGRAFDSVPHTKNGHQDRCLGKGFRAQVWGWSVRQRAYDVAASSRWQVECGVSGKAAVALLFSFLGTLT